MAGEFTNTSQVKTNFFAKGMVKDLSDINIPDGVWTHAINAVNNSHMGKVHPSSLSKENPSKCLE